MKVRDFINDQIRKLDFFIGRNIGYIYLILIFVFVFAIVLHFLPSQYAKGYEAGQIELFKRIVHTGF